MAKQSFWPIKVTFTLIIAWLLVYSNHHTKAQLVMESHLYKRIIEDVHTIFNNTCVILLYTVENPMQALGLYEAEQLMSIPVYIARLHVRTFAYAIRTFKESIGDSYFTLKRPLFVLINDSEEMRQQFSNEISAWISMAYINWVIFFGEETNAKEFFSEIYVPLDCIFLIVQKVTGDRSLEISEVYHIAKGRELIKSRFGSWDEEEGLSFTGLALYQRRSDLRGQLIRVASIEDPPVSLIQNDVSGKVTGIKGFFGTIVQILQENMNCTVTYTESESWGFLESNGSWTGVVGMLVRKEIDLAATELLMTSDRLNAIEYTTPVFSTKCRIFIKRPYYTAIKWTAYSDPFYSGIWISLLLMVQLSSAFTLIGCKVSPYRRAFDEQRVDSFTFADTFFHTFGVMCAQGHDSVKIDSLRIISVVIHMLGVIILAAYSAALISFLAVKVFVMPFTTMAGLLDDGSYKFAVIRDSADYSLFQTSSDKTLQRMFTEILDEVHNLPRNYLEGLNDVCSKDKHAFMIMDNMFAILEHQVPCILEPLDTIMQTTVAMAVPRRSPFRGIINNNILLMRDSGILQRVIATELLLQSTRIKDHWVSVEIVDVLPLLLLCLGGSLSGLIVLLLEKLRVSKLKNLSNRPFNVNLNNFKY